MRSFALAALLALTAPAGARADAVEDFYRGKTLHFVIGSNNGGGYDSYGRVMANHIGAHIPGAPNVVVENMPGASGVTSANYLYRIAPKDGSVIGLFNQSMGQRQMLEPKSVNFDCAGFNWLGAMASSVNVIITWRASGVTTIEDARKREVVLGALTNDGGNSIYPRLLNQFLGTKLKVVLGYQGGNTIQLAMERGEVEGRGAVVWSGLKAGWPQWIAEGKISELVQIGLAKDADLPDVPLLIDLAKNDTERAIFRFISSDASMAFPVVAPPGVPAARVAALRKAFDETMDDPAFQAEADKRHLPMRRVAGEDVRAIVQSVISTPPDVIAQLKAAIGEANKGD
jgi:tripartite-type tricarboxylate transporter receptor subunit TctC